MSRTAWILLSLLVVALLASYFSWTHEPEGTTDQPVEVVRLDPGDLDYVQLVTKNRTVTLEAKTDERGRYYEITLEDQPIPISPPKTPEPADGSDGGTEATSQPEAGTDGGPVETSAPAEPPPPAEPPQPKVRRFTGGKGTERLAERLAPLKAFRVLEEVPDERLEALGLTDAETTLELGRGEKRWKFAVGGEEFGAARRYLNPVGTSTVYLVEAVPFRQLEGAERQLLERSVVGVLRPDVVAVNVSVGAQSRRLLQQDRADRRAAYWAAEDKPSEKAELAGGWLDKLFTLRADDYPDPVPTDLEPICQVVFETEEVREPLELLRGPGADGEADFYARSGFLRRLVKLRRQAASEVVADLGAVIAE